MMQPAAGSLLPTTERQLFLSRCGILLLLASAAAIAYLTRHCLAVANTTMQREIGLTNEEFGYLYSAFSLGYLICQIPGGWLGQRIGVRAALPILAAFWAAMTCVTALVTSLPALVASRFFFGLAQAGLVPNQAQAVRNWIPDAARGLASSVLVVAMSAGAIASLALTGLLMKSFPWRTIFIAYGGATLVWSILFWWAYRDTPPTRSESPDDHAPGKIAPLVGVKAGLPLLIVLTSAGVWGLSLQALFKTAGYNFLVTFLPTFLELAHQMPTEDTASLASWSLLAVMAGSLLGGILVDYVQRLTGRKWCSRCLVGSGSMVLTAGILFIATLCSTAASVAMVIAVASFFSGIGGAPPWAATMDLGGRGAAVVMGMMNSISAFAGIIISPLVGRMIDWIRLNDLDWSLVLLVHAAFYLLSAASWILVRPDHSLDKSEAGHAG
jgi:MFS family permease